MIAYILNCIMDIVFIALCIYGFFVLKDWHLAAKNINKLCNEFQEERKGAESDGELR